jgi:glucose uptake protein GlcU
MLAGLIWNVGNICTVLAVATIGFEIAVPIRQCGMFVAGVIGIAWFGELRGARAGALWLWWVSGCVLLSGAWLLARSGA